MGDEESSEDSGDEYVQERHAPKGKARVKRRSKGDARGGGGERRQTQGKRKRKQQLEDIDLSQLPPEQGTPTSSIISG